MIQVLEGELTNQKTTETSQIWPVKTIEGRSGGTYVVKELAIDYAASVYQVLTGLISPVKRLVSFK
jgi:hypothetical protein